MTDSGSRPAVTLRSVSKSFEAQSGSGRIEALQDVSLDFPQGSFTTLLGPSGCGKTTLLRLVNGLIAPDSGEILIDGAAPKPGPQMGFVFQSFRLLPWRSVRDNVAFALEVAGVSSAPRLARADEALAAVGLTRFADSYPGELSGGMRQRAALARALVGEPRILLMDEPFASLDAQTRELMQEELLRIWAARQCVVIFVTHSVDEALLLGERVILMSPRPGRIAEILENPLDRLRASEALRAEPEFLARRSHLWERIRSMVLADPASDFYGR